MDRIQRAIRKVKKDFPPTFKFDEAIDLGGIVGKCEHVSRKVKDASGFIGKTILIHLIDRPAIGVDAYLLTGKLRFTAISAL